MQLLEAMYCRIIYKHLFPFIHQCNILSIINCYSMLWFLFALTKADWLVYYLNLQQLPQTFPTVLEYKNNNKQNVIVTQCYMIPNINKLNTVKALVSIYKAQVGVDMVINFINRWLWSGHFFSYTVLINNRDYNSYHLLLFGAGAYHKHHRKSGYTRLYVTLYKWLPNWKVEFLKFMLCKW